jgi:hypothetical protein
MGTASESAPNAGSETLDEIIEAYRFGALEFAEGLEQAVGKRFIRDAEQPDRHNVER